MEPNLQNSINFAYEDNEKLGFDNYNGNGNPPITTSPPLTSAYENLKNLQQSQQTGPSDYQISNSSRHWSTPIPGSSNSLQRQGIIDLRESPLQTQVDILDFSMKSVRLGFTRKVYGIVLIQLLITGGIIALFVFHKGINQWVPENPAFLGAAIGVAIVLTIITFLAKGLRRNSPQNLILLVVLTISYGILTGSICSYFENEAILYAAAISMAVTLGLALFSLQRKFNFTIWAGILVSLLVLGIAFGILVILRANDVIEIESLHLVYACAGACLLSVLLVYDMKRIVGGTHCYDISPEEYVLGAIAIYTDVLIIFIFLVLMLGAAAAGGGNSDNNDCKCSGSGGRGGCCVGGYTNHYAGQGHCCVCCCPMEDSDDIERSGEVAY
jgi:hypothetical protein